MHVVTRNAYIRLCLTATSEKHKLLLKQEAAGAQEQKMASSLDQAIGGPTPAKIILKQSTGMSLNDRYVQNLSLHDVISTSQEESSFSAS